jgi:L-cysteate sulfo-lyase
MEATLMDATRTAAGAKRLPLAHLPTPLEPLERLSRELGGPAIWVKRDDCTGLAGGGNKTRKLEFLLGDALDRGADTVLTAGAVQSNHARQTAAACARLGLRCELFLKEAAPGRGESYRHSGNVLLDRILGAKVHILPREASAETAMEEHAEALRREGRRPYTIPVGGSNAVGALGYVGCARELSAQADGIDLKIDAVVHASASHGTQAGLAVGLAMVGAQARLIGVSVSGSAQQTRSNVERIAAATCGRLGSPLHFVEIEVDDRFVGEGYGIPTPAGLAAIRLLARLEGLLLDPVYTGKAMAGIMELVREGRFGSDDNVVFLHTGGWPALFAYKEELAEEGMAQ